MICRLATHLVLPSCAAFEWTRDEQDLRDHIERRLLYVAEERDKVIAYARLESFWRTIPYLALIVVEGSRRGQGCGTALLAFIKNDLKNRGFQSLLSSSTDGEEGPIRWHLKQGFQRIGMLDRLNADGVGEQFFILDL